MSHTLTRTLTTPEWQQLQALTRSISRPLLAGNHVELLRDGAETFGAMYEAVDEARDHINVASYIVENQGPGEELLSRLVARRRKGVRVNLAFDSAGCWGTSRRVFEALRRDGISLLEHHPLGQLRTWVGNALQRRNHRKLMIVDGRTGFIGGLNISGVYAGSSPLKSDVSGDVGADAFASADWRDTHVRVQGPVVNELQQLFIDQWKRHTGRGPGGEACYFPIPRAAGQHRAGVAAAECGPGHNDFYRALLAAVGAASSRIYITSAYFVPPRRLLRALTDAAQRGVDVQLVLPGRSDFWAPLHAGRWHFGSLLRAGVRIHERHDRLLHAKTAVIDGVWATVGSSNLDWRSLVHNAEANLVVLDSAFALQMEAMFRQDVAQSREVLLHRWLGRGGLDKMKEWTARRFEFLL
ncbi:phosphatidylserine/phosphatidylglycerophosphate/cardiolipin synthase family protein [Pelomonas sp. KK5]|uniref:phospholipase D-like domain-containing protein n=1 Tax=Pelomonas sp. KK5 TaxID=1855730 RepID=UPI001301AFE9|nr:phospholipase D-like domain-containing protein [Pelomonas sp. KK5]